MSPPNQLTFVRILLTPVFLAFLLVNHRTYNQLALPVFVVASLTDWYDGWVARKWGYVSRWGRFLDPLADKVLSSAAFISFIYLDLAPPWMVWIIVVRDILVTLLRSLAEYKDRPVVTSGPAKTKTFIQFVVVFYVLILHTLRITPSIYQEHKSAVDFLLNQNLLFALMLVVTALTAWTGIVYLIDNRKTLVELYASVVRTTQSQ
ncbi:MAG: CDP-diacylglycerol--glycerol-3-phosphate 3-phosphatidyltransferase [Bacteroidota bacterium]